MPKKSEIVEWWRLARDRPAWMVMIKNLLRLEREEEIFLENLEDAHLAHMKVLKIEWNNAYDKLKKPDVSKKWQTDTRLRYLKHKLERLQADLVCWSIDYKTLSEKDAPMFEQRMVLQNIVEVLPIVSRIGFEIKFLNGGVDSERLSESKIEQARSVPIDGLLVVKNGYALCPLHSDSKPSMWVKNGFGYCFVCNQSLDAIGFMMKVKGLSFKKAVEALC